MEPRYNEVPRNWKNVFAITRFRYIKVLFHIFYYYWSKESHSLYRGLRYIEVRCIEVPLYNRNELEGRFSRKLWTTIGAKWKTVIDNPDPAGLLMYRTRSPYHLPASPTFFFSNILIFKTYHSKLDRTPHQVTSSHMPFETCLRKITLRCLREMSRQRSDWWKSTIANPRVQSSFRKRNQVHFPSTRWQSTLPTQVIFFECHVTTYIQVLK